MSGRLRGRVALVTGAASGPRAALGSVFAKALASEGAHVALADLHDCSSVAHEIERSGGQALALRADVRNEASVVAMVEQAVARFGQLDILVNNAAIGSNIPPVPVLDLTAEAWDELYAVNVRGPFLCVKAVLPHMRARKYGKIINIGSTTAITGLPNRLHYVSAKGAIHAMTRALSHELGPDGICVNTIAYGLISSELTEREMAQHPEHQARVFGPRAMKVHLRAQDVAGGLVYLASPESDHMTGQRLIVDPGGVHT
jgi:NAD(P)-dependent dehydrogenase (short-subunit alcohol dehydrogenase family)